MLNEMILQDASINIKPVALLDENVTTSRNKAAERKPINFKDWPPTVFYIWLNNFHLEIPQILKVNGNLND